MSRADSGSRALWEVVDLITPTLVRARRTFGAGLLGAFLSLSACGQGDGGIVGLRIVQTQVAVQGGATATSLQLTLLADVEDGPDVDVSASALWSSDAPGTAGVLLGNVTGVTAGRTTIRATYFGRQASVPATVSCVPGPTPLPVQVNDLGTGLGIGDSPNTFRNLCIDTLGRIHVAWSDPATGLRYARSIDGGVSFQASGALVDLIDAPVPNPQIACGQEGQDDVYVFYADAASNLRCLRSSDAGVTWPAAGTVTGLTPGGLYGVGVRGTTLVALSTVGVTLVRSTDAATTWAAPVPTFISTAVFSDVLMDPRNANVVAVTDNPTVRTRTSPDDGVTFAAELTHGAPGLFFSDYAIDQAGRVFCVGTPAEWAIFDVDAQTFTQVASSLPAGGSSERTVTVDSANVVHLVRTNGSGDVLLQLSADQGATVSAEVTLDTGCTLAQSAASRHFLGVGVLYLRGGNVYYQHN